MAEGDCAKAVGDKVTKSAVAPAATSFNIDDLRRVAATQEPIENQLKQQRSGVMLDPSPTSKGEAKVLAGDAMSGRLGLSTVTRVLTNPGTKA
jgi:hypothetical protein